jgi:hypothetical protein
MGVEPAYPVTLSAVTVRAAYFEGEQLMCLPNDLRTAARLIVL